MMTKCNPQRYPGSMATRDDPPTGKYADDLARLDKSAAKVKRLRAQLRDAERDARKDVATALASCIEAGRPRVEVQEHAPFSAPVVRAIGDDAGIPPDERYVRGKKD